MALLVCDAHWIVKHLQCWKDVADCVRVGVDKVNKFSLFEIQVVAKEWLPWIWKMEHYIVSKQLQQFWPRGYIIFFCMLDIEVHNCTCHEHVFVNLLFCIRAMVELIFLPPQHIHVLEMAMPWLHGLGSHLRYTFRLCKFCY